MRPMMAVIVLSAPYLPSCGFATGSQFAEQVVMLFLVPVAVAFALPDLLVIVVVDLGTTDIAPALRAVGETRSPSSSSRGYDGTC